MRTIVRTKVKVPTLYAADGAGAKKARANREKFDAGQFEVKTTGSNNLKFPAHWNKADVRGALYAQQGWVCAYCGIELRRGDRGDVEHYRPKQKVQRDAEHGGYWWLAYDFNNYVLSCGPCNRNRKKAKFPLLDQAAGRVTFPTREQLPAEARLLLDPGADTLEDVLRIDWQSPSCSVVPAEEIPAARKTQVEGMVEFFRVNRDVELLRARRLVVEQVLELIEEGKPDEAAKFAIRYRPHSLVARQILIEKGLAAHLPTFEQEVAWFFAELVGRISDLLDSLEMFPGDDILLDELDELLWSLAVLIAADDIDVSLMEKALLKLGLLDEVQAKMQRFI